MNSSKKNQWIYIYIYIYIFISTKIRIRKIYMLSYVINANII